MKNRRLLDALEKIDDEYIEEASPVEAKNNKLPWIKWTAIAASVALIAFVGISALNSSNKEPEILPNLPSLDSSIEFGGMGFEGIMVHDITECDNNNPWSEDIVLQTLPVFRNLAYFSGAGETVYFNKNKMTQIAQTAADALGEKIISIKCEPDNCIEGNVYTLLYAETESYKISVNGNGFTGIEFKIPALLPEEYSFDKGSTTKQEAQKTILYLSEEYKKLTGFSYPASTLFVSYGFSGERGLSFGSYDKSEDILQSILNFSFNSVWFYPDFNGELYLIHKNNLLSSSLKLGDYPIISSKDAKKMLLEGNYITSVPKENLKNEKIRKADVDKVELVYLTRATIKTYMPYYKFYVELIHEEGVEMAKGLTTYGIFYVPAVRGEYLSDFPPVESIYN